MEKPSEETITIMALIRDLETKVRKIRKDVNELIVLIKEGDRKWIHHIGKEEENLRRKNVLNVVL